MAEYTSDSRSTGGVSLEPILKCTAGLKRNHGNIQRSFVIHSYQTRFAATQNLLIQRVPTNSGIKTISCRGTSLWTEIEQILNTWSHGIQVLFLFKHVSMYALIVYLHLSLQGLLSLSGFQSWVNAMFCIQYFYVSTLVMCSCMVRLYSTWCNNVLRAHRLDNLWFSRF